MANETKPLFRPAHHITVQATADVAGCRLVDITAGYDGNPFKVAHCAAGKKAFGVADADIPNGQFGTILRAGIIPITAGGTITAGQQVESDAQGRIIELDEGVAIGTAVQSGTIHNLVQVALSVAS